METGHESHNTMDGMRMVKYEYGMKMRGSKRNMHNQMQQ